MSLQQQTQREIEQHAKTEKYLKKKLLKILNFQQNRCYKLTESKKEADAFIMFDESDFSNFTILVCNSEENIALLESSPNNWVFPLRCTNRRDTKKALNGELKKKSHRISKSKII